MTAQNGSLGPWSAGSLGCWESKTLCFALLLLSCREVSGTWWGGIWVDLIPKAGKQMLKELRTVIFYQPAQMYCKILVTHTSILVLEYPPCLNKTHDFKSSLFPQHKAKQCALPDSDLLCHYWSKTYNYMTHGGYKALAFVGSLCNW